MLLILVLAPILAFYVLADLHHIRRSAMDLCPPSIRDEMTLLGRRLGQAIGGYFRGQLVVALIVGVLCSIGLYIIDLPFWLVIGMFAGLCNMIPLIGPFIGAVPGIVLALATGEVGTAIWVAVIMTVVQQIDNNFISPNVMKRAAKVHPVVVMLSLTLGGSLFGFWGLLVAVPATAVLKIIAGHLWNVYLLDEPYADYYHRIAGLDLEPGVGPVEDVLGHGADRAPGAHGHRTDVDPHGDADPADPADPAEDAADLDDDPVDEPGLEDPDGDEPDGDDPDRDDLTEAAGTTLADAPIGPEIVLGPDAEHGTAKPSRARRIPLGEGVRRGDRHTVREP